MKSGKNPPKGSKPASSFERLPGQSRMQKSSSTVEKVYKTKKKDKIYYRKLTPGALAEIQAFESHCYRLLLGDMTPKSKTTHDDLKKTTKEVYSREIPNLQTFSEYHRKNKKYPNQNALIKAGLGKLLTASYLFGEGDLHSGNIGLIEITRDEEYQLFKFDHDRSMYSITHRYDIYRDVFKDYSESTPITQDNLNNLPKLQDNNLRHFFPFKEYNEEIDDENIDILAMQKDPVFNHDKWLTCLKFLLLTKNVYSKIWDYTGSDNELGNEIVNYKMMRRDSLLKQLLKNEQFMEFVRTNKDGLEKNIMDSLDQYNKSFKKIDHGLKITEVDLKNIRHELNIIIDSCQQKSSKKGDSHYNLEKNELSQQANIEDKNIEEILTAINNEIQNVKSAVSLTHFGSNKNDLLIIQALNLLTKLIKEGVSKGRTRITDINDAILVWKHSAFPETLKTVEKISDIISRKDSTVHLIDSLMIKDVTIKLKHTSSK